MGGVEEDLDYFVSGMICMEVDQEHGVTSFPT